MTSVAKFYFKNSVKNSEHCSLFLIGKPVKLMRIIIFSVFAFLTSACDSNKTSLIAYTGETMGTEYVIKALQNNELDSDKVDQAIKQTLQDINQSMSTYIADSEVSLFNAVDHTNSVAVSPELQQVLAESLAISTLTEGAFDITVAPAINSWGFDADGKIVKQPEDAELQQMRDSIGYQLLSLTDSSLAKANPNTTINLSAIAKGYAVDKVAEQLESFGIENYLVNIGGELRAKGKNHQQQLWRVGIEKPEILGGVEVVFPLENQAVATSGDYRNFITIGGQKFSHAIDPRTLKPIIHRLTSVSVLSDKASTADALATALLVMGEEKAYQFALKQGLSVHLIIRDDKSEYIVKRTGQFLQLTE